uniref:CRISPR system precrRNA processing endoribonuclease RAMP protein Cas6 n=1 Tax=Mycobacterium tuberculosis TaxID=1773 RepID=UPI0020745E97|nr:CRISPR system precrRNA processing endoribonuclease RAMP protein Cas6 [Mycobacterium tuberculosis]
MFPGFTGSATFTVRGVDTFASYIAALLWFGEFSGCGIKASMGMGAIRVQPLAPREKCVPKP